MFGRAGRYPPLTSKNQTSTDVDDVSREFDPWRATGMASEVRPGGPLASTDDVAVFLIKNAEHASDALTARGMANLKIKANPEVVKVQEQSVEVMKKWISQYLVGKASP